MITNYDAIAEDYRTAKRQPWRKYVEQYTLLSMVGDIRRKSVADFACGEGYYTRLLAGMGADTIVGVDQSRRMIELARSEEAANPRGIEYIIADVADYDSGDLDLVFAAWLLNYARDVRELREMTDAIARALKPGGRFITVNNNPSDPPANFSVGSRYGFSKRLTGKWEEGVPIVWRFFLPDADLEVTNYRLSLNTVQESLAASGFNDITWYEPQLSPEGSRLYGRHHWQPILNAPPMVFLACTLAA